MPWQRPSAHRDYVAFPKTNAKSILETSKETSAASCISRAKKLCRDLGFALVVDQTDLGNSAGTESDNETSMIGRSEVDDVLARREGTNASADGCVLLVEQGKRFGGIDVLPIRDMASDSRNDQKSDISCR